jgi:hypothetical protein
VNFEVKVISRRRELMCTQVVMLPKQLSVNSFCARNDKFRSLEKATPSQICGFKRENVHQCDEVPDLAVIVLRFPGHFTPVSNSDGCLTFQICKLSSYLKH